MGGMTRTRDDTAAADAQPAKKVRASKANTTQETLPVGPDGHQVGSVVRVTLHDFLTYTDAEFRPGPRINLVVGPNGTGKSSVVCALGLGLGCKPKTLGRAEQEVSFIRQGCESCWCEIELQSPPGQKNVIVKMSIVKTPGGSAAVTWKLNGKSTTRKEVQKTVKSLHINMDSLLQLLPQDRVHEFSGLSPTALLQQTEEAVDADGLYTDHQKLIDWEREQNDLRLSLAEKQANLADLNRAQAILKRDKLKYERRLAHLERAENLKLKRPWLEFEAQQAETQALKVRVENARAMLDRLKEESDPLIQKQQEATLAYKKAKGKHDAAKKTKQDLERKQARLESDIEPLSDDIQEKKTQLSSVAAMRKSIQADLVRHQERLEDAQESLAALGAKSENKSSSKEKQEIARCKLRLTELKKILTGRVGENTRTSTELTRKKDQRVSLVSQLKRLASVKDRVIQALAGRDETFKPLFDWFNKNKERLNDPPNALGPVAAHMRIKKKEYAAFIEHQAPGWLFRSIVCSNTNDFRTLNTEIQDKKKKTVPITHIDMASTSRIQRSATPAQMKKFGLECWLDETFDAPQIIKEAFISHAGFSGAAIGREGKVDVDAVFRETKITGIFLLPGTLYTRQWSRHHKEPITSRIQLRKPWIFANGEGNDVDRTRLEGELALLNEEIKELEADQEAYRNEIKPYVHEDVQLKNKVEALQKNDAMRSKLGTTIRMTKTQIAQFEKRLAETTEEKSRADLDRALVKLRGKFETLSDLYLDVHKAHLAKVSAAARALQATSAMNGLKQAYDNVVRSIKKYEEVLDKKTQEFKQAKKLLKAKMKEASEKAPITDELKEMFKDMPRTLDELDLAIEEEQVKADALFVSDPSVLEKFKNRQAEIDNLTEVVDKEQATMNEIIQTVATHKEAWLTPLRELIQAINESFARYMEFMGCSGEVILANEDPDKFSSYGLKILVSFRDSGELQELIRSRQSGGEKSVSTMLFLLSLQEVTICPFRVVDEINQGMDAYNERKVFELATSNQASSGRAGMAPQYFIVTPKLLTSLDYNENVTVFVVYNGEYSINQDDLDPESFVQFRQSQQR